MIPEAMTSERGPAALWLDKTEVLGCAGDSGGGLVAEADPRLQGTERQHTQ